MMSLETITPEMAADLLDANDGNRPLRPAHVERLAASMMDGGWIVNGATIGVCEDGSLSDGQHRLAACVLAETPFETYVVRGLSSRAQDVTDIGSKRTLADQLSRRGEVNRYALAAGILWHWRIQMGPTAIRTTVKSAGLPHEVAIAHLAANPSIRDSVVVARSSDAKRIVTLGSSWLAALHAHLMDGDKADQAEGFFHTFFTGEMIERRCPVGDLRNKLSSIRGSKAPAKRVKAWYPLALTIRAWNMFSAGRKGKVHFHLGDSNKTKIPEIVGGPVWKI